MRFCFSRMETHSWIGWAWLESVLYAVLLVVCFMIYFKSRLVASPGVILCGWLGSKHHLTNSLSCLKVQKPTLCAHIVHVLLFSSFFFPYDGSGNGSVGLDCGAICFPVAWLGRETIFAYCGIPNVMHLCLDCVCRCDLGTVLPKRRDVKRISWQCLIVVRWFGAADRTLKSSY